MKLYAIALASLLAFNAHAQLSISIDQGGGGVSSECIAAVFSGGATECERRVEQTRRANAEASNILAELVASGQMTRIELYKMRRDGWEDAEILDIKMGKNPFKMRIR